MKINWGTGILIFLILFLSASAVFIVFAMKQDVNLVHKDYYEQGADYTEQMKVNARSVEFNEAVHTQIEIESLVVDFDTTFTLSIDSGNVLLFRPSNSSLDYSMPLQLSGNSVMIPKSNLVPGRYILKLNWYSGGLKYEVVKTVFIQ